MRGEDPRGREVSERPGLIRQKSGAVRLSKSHQIKSLCCLIPFCHRTCLIIALIPTHQYTHILHHQLRSLYSTTSLCTLDLSSQGQRLHIFGDDDPPHTSIPVQPVKFLPDRDLGDPTPTEQLPTILRNVSQRYSNRLVDTTRRDLSDTFEQLQDLCLAVERLNSEAQDPLNRSNERAKSVTKRYIQTASILQNTLKFRGLPRTTTLSTKTSSAWPKRSPKNFAHYSLSTVTSKLPLLAFIQRQRLPRPC